MTLLALDLGVFHRKSKTDSFRTSVMWTLFWISLALGFNVIVWLNLGEEAALTFLTAYLVEQSLSVDNLFVFILIFSAFKIPMAYQHRVLFWGIIGALVMRAICIGAGVAALQKFLWLTYVFGAILVWSGIKIFFDQDHDKDPSKGLAARIFQKFVPYSTQFNGDRFFVVENGVKKATPMLLALVIVEASDLIFAVDSIPAVLSISTDPFIVYTSNIFAIMGLRSLYFVLAHVVHLFRYLKYGLSVILIFVGIKIATSHFYKLPVAFALGVIVATLAVSILASVLIKPKDATPA